MSKRLFHSHPGERAKRDLDYRKLHCVTLSLPAPKEKVGSAVVAPGFGESFAALSTPSDAVGFAQTPSAFPSACRKGGSAEEGRLQ